MQQTTLRRLALTMTLAFCVSGASAQQQTINPGTGPNTGTGDSAPVAFGKINSNFTDLYTRLIRQENAGSARDQSVQVLLNSVPGKAPLASPNFTGVVTIPTLNLTGGGSTGPVSTMTAADPSLSGGLSLGSWVALLAGQAPSLAALRSLPTGPFASGKVVMTGGYYAAGDHGGGTFVWSPTSAATDDGCTAVTPSGMSGTGRWLRQIPSAGIDVRMCGAKGDGINDDGPAIRAAIKWATNNGRGDVHFPAAPLGYLVASADPSGYGALVIGDGTSTKGASLIGDAYALELPETTYSGRVRIKLGAGLNVPLITIRKGVATPTLRHLSLDGNRAAQTGATGPLYAGKTGFAAKLYTVHLEDAASITPESGLMLEDDFIAAGYNGNFYLGAFRGSVSWLRTWSQYSGQDATDGSIVLNGYDVEFESPQVGGNTGFGLYVLQGIQYQMRGGAFFQNPVHVRINAPVQHFADDGTTFQVAGTNAIQTFGDGTAKGSRSFVNASFQSNSASATGVYSDILATNDARLSVVAPSFHGDDGSSGTRPKYHIECSGTCSIKLVSPTWTPGTSAASGLLNNCAYFTGQFNYTCPWTPVLQGDSTAGSPTYSRQSGSWTRTNNTVSASFTIETSALGGPSGNLQIGGFPMFSTANTSDYGACAFAAFGGWTAPSGYTSLGAFVAPSGTVAYVLKSGTAAQAAPTALASEFGAATRLYGTCTYRVDG